MPAPVIAALLLPALAGYLGGRANVQLQQAQEAKKAQDVEAKNLLAFGESLSQGKGGEADVQALQALSHRFQAIPGGQSFFDAFMTRAQGVTAQTMSEALMKQMTQQRMMEAFGFAPPGGSPGAPQPTTAPAAPQSDFQRVSSTWPSPAPPQPGQTPGTPGALNPQDLSSAGLPGNIAQPGPSGPPRPSGPFTGQVGATPLPETPVESAKPGFAGSRPTPQAGIPGMMGLDMDNAQPGDMNQFVGQPGAMLNTPPEDIGEAVRRGLAPAPASAPALPPPGQPLTAKAIDQAQAQGPAQQGPITLPPFLKSGLGSFTIPKEMSGLGVELRGTADELKHHFAARMRQQGMSPTAIYNEFQTQGVAAPESLQKDAFNDFSKRFFTTPEMLQQPRRALEAIAEHFPGASLEAMQGFGRDVFQSAYLGAKQRLRTTGQFLTESSLSQAAFNEANGAVGSQFVPPSVLNDLQHSRVSSTESLMADLLDKGISGDSRAMDMYKVLVEHGSKRLRTDEAAKTIAKIKAEQSAEFLSDESRSRNQVNGQALPFGTTPAAAAQLAQKGQLKTVLPEEQAARVQRAKAVDETQFMAEQALPTIETARSRIVAIMDLVDKEKGIIGGIRKGAATLGAPTELGQALKGYDEFRSAYAGTIRALVRDSAGVMTNADEVRIMQALPNAKDFVEITVNRRNELIRKMAEVDSSLSGQLGKKVEIMKPIIERLQAVPSDTQRKSNADDLIDRIEGRK